MDARGPPADSLRRHLLAAGEKKSLSIGGAGGLSTLLSGRLGVVLPGGAEDPEVAVLHRPHGQVLGVWPELHAGYLT